MGDNDGASCCNEPQHAFIYLYILYVLIVIITWGTMLAKPMRLLTTAVHEISHALACWITGGQVEAIEVYTNEGGVTRFRGGCRCLINCAGYLGEAFWGMMFVLLSGGRLTSTFAASGLIVALLISLCYSPNRVLVALNIFYAIVTLAFILVEWYVFTPILMYVTLLYGCCYPRCVGVTWLIIAVLFQMIGIWLALILMSDECGDDGWFECVFHSKFDLDLLEFDWWPDDWDLFDQ